MYSVSDCKGRIFVLQRSVIHITKMNGLQDPAMIDRLYEASQRGVQIDLIVRGICCLIPGQSYSRNIRVTRIVDTFLEHARVWYFGNTGHPKIYFGSPDWMRRSSGESTGVTASIRR